jgi:GntR family transcriptional regulator
VESRFTPRYYEIEQALRAEIAVLVPGDPVPSDADLSRRFEVSRMTVRQAFQALVQEGLVERRSGRGTFVADPPSHRKATVLLGFSDEARRKGRRPTSDVLESGVRPPTAEESKALRRPADDEVVFVTRLRSTDARPIALERAVLTSNCRFVLDADLATTSLHAALRRGGVHPTRGRATIFADHAGAVEAELLEVVENHALLVERRLIVDQFGTPVEFTESRYAASRYDLEVEFVVEAAPDAPSER